MMEGIAENLDVRIMYYDVAIPKLGFVKGEKDRRAYSLTYKGKTFDELKIPLKVTAVDLRATNQLFWIRGRSIRLFVPAFQSPVFLYRF